MALPIRRQTGVFGERSLTLGRLGGVEVRVGASWLFIVALLTWSFWARFDADHRFQGPTAFVLAVVAAALLLVSVLAHELAHSLEARHRGIPVGGITLFLFGGVTETSMEARRPVDEFALTAVGPFTSLALGALFGLLGFAAQGLGFDAPAAVFGAVGWLNIVLAVFNLLPGAPLDGGRIVRALAWRVTGDRVRATIIAAWAGRAVGALLLVLGLFQIFFVPVAFVNGLWMALIGWFLAGVATTEAAQARLRQSLAGVPVRRFVGGRTQSIRASASVADAVDGWFHAFGEDAFLVVNETARLVGVVTIDEARGLPAHLRDTSSVAEVMRPLDGVARVTADTPADAVLDSLTGDGVVLVEDEPGGEVLGVLTVRTLLSGLERQRELGIAQRQPEQLRR